VGRDRCSPRFGDDSQGTARYNLCAPYLSSCPLAASTAFAPVRSCLGKVVSGGLPSAAFGERRKVMERIAAIFAGQPAYRQVGLRGWATDGEPGPDFDGDNGRYLNGQVGLRLAIIVRLEQTLGAQPVEVDVTAGPEELGDGEPFVC
jgi:hypothetical protein